MASKSPKIADRPLQSPRVIVCEGSDEYDVLNWIRQQRELTESIVELINAEGRTRLKTVLDDPVYAVLVKPAARRWLPLRPHGKRLPRQPLSHAQVELLGVVIGGRFVRCGQWPTPQALPAVDDMAGAGATCRSLENHFDSIFAGSGER